MSIRVLDDIVLSPVCVFLVTELCWGLSFVWLHESGAVYVEMGYLRCEACFRHVIHAPASLHQLPCQLLFFLVFLGPGRQFFGSCLSKATSCSKCNSSRHEAK